MHGLIFATWERFLFEKHGSRVKDIYRSAVEGKIEDRWALADRSYDDEVFIQGVRAASGAIDIFPPELLREFGQYFLNNAFTVQKCAYLLEKAESSQNLLTLLNGSYISFEPLMTGHNALLLRYNNHRLLCPLLYGCIKGTAEHYGEHVTIRELSCMQYGAQDCLMDIRFERDTEALDLNVVDTLSKSDDLADMVLGMLSYYEGYTLGQVKKLLKAHHGVPQEQARLRTAYTAISHLQHAGLVRSSTEQSLETRKYWRV
jgi:hypothetical protein